MPVSDGATSDAVASAVSKGAFDMAIEMRSRMCGVLVVGVLASWSGAAFAQSATTTFSYDALGRLVSASTAGGPAGGESTTIGYDPAGNRTSHAVTGVPAGLLAKSAPPSEAAVGALGE